VEGGCKGDYIWHNLTDIKVNPKIILAQSDQKPPENRIVERKMVINQPIAAELPSRTTLQYQAVGFGNSFYSQKEAPFGI
jgi:hypothetical protein